MKRKTRARQIARATLKEILNFYPITDADAFKIARVSLSTWRRWKAGTANPPPAVVELIRLAALGAVSDPAFDGFTIKNGILTDSHGAQHTPDDIRALTIYKRHAFAYYALQRELEKKAEAQAPAPKTALYLVK